MNRAVYINMHREANALAERLGIAYYIIATPDGRRGTMYQRHDLKPRAVAHEFEVKVLSDAAGRFEARELRAASPTEVELWLLLISLAGQGEYDRERGRLQAHGG